MTNKPDLTNAYLDLMKKTLSASIFPQARMGPAPDYKRRPRLKAAVRLLRERGLTPVNMTAYSETEVNEGRIWGLLGFTMVGHDRLNNVQFCVEDVLKRNVPGDLVETGVWKGGTSIFMRAILKAYGVKDRKV